MSSSKSRVVGVVWIGGQLSSTSTLRNQLPVLGLPYPDYAMRRIGVGVYRDEMGALSS